MMKQFIVYATTTNYSEIKLELEAANYIRAKWKLEEMLAEGIRYTIWEGRTMVYRHHV